MNTVMMYQAIQRNQVCTGIGFGTDGKLLFTRFFADGPWESITNAMLDWTRDGRLDNQYDGEVAK
jgi:hypothetical protein